MTYQEMLKAAQNGLTAMPRTTKYDQAMWGNTEPRVVTPTVDNIDLYEMAPQMATGERTLPQPPEVTKREPGIPMEQLPPSSGSMLDFNIPGTDRRVSELQFMPTENYMSNVGKAAKSVYENTNIVPEYIKQGFQNLIRPPQQQTTPTEMPMQAGAQSVPQPQEEGLMSYLKPALKTLGYGILGAGMGYGGATPGQITNVFTQGQENYNRNNPDSPLSRQMQRLVKGYGDLYKDEINQNPEFAELFSQDVTSLPASALMPYFSRLSELHSNKMAEQKYNAMYGPGALDSTRANIIGLINRSPIDEEQKIALIESVKSDTNPTSLMNLQNNLTKEFMRSQTIQEKEIKSTKQINAYKQQIPIVLDQLLSNKLIPESEYNAIKDVLQNVNDEESLKGLLSNLQMRRDLKTKADYAKEAELQKQEGRMELQNEKYKAQKMLFDEKVKDQDKRQAIKFLQAQTLLDLKNQFNKETANQKLINSNFGKFQKEINEDDDLLNSIDKALELHKETKDATYVKGKGWVKDGKIIKFKRNIASEVNAAINPSGIDALFNQAYKDVISAPRHKLYGSAFTTGEKGESDVQYFNNSLSTVGERIYYLTQLKDMINTKKQNMMDRVPALKTTESQIENKEDKMKKIRERMINPNVGRVQ